MTEPIRVEMLGDLRICAGTSVLPGPTEPAAKHWQLLCYLLLQPGQAADAEDLGATLWPNNTPGDQAALLEKAAGELLAAFEAAGVATQPVIADGERYVCNPSIPFDVDALGFADSLATGRDDLEPEQLRDILALYKGRLLPIFDTTPWAAPLAARFRQLFSDAAEALCASLYAEFRWNDLLEAANTLTETEPAEEGLYVYIFRALSGLAMPRAIIPAYHRVSRLFSEEFGRKPGWEIQDIYLEACEQVDEIEQDILVIKDDLRTCLQENSEANTPLYCTYDVFRYLYQMASRAASRSGRNVALMLVSLKGPGRKDDLHATKKLSSAMNQVKAAILGGLLRKSDTVTRYSLNQYLVMLSIDKPENATIVAKRIDAHCAPLLATSDLSLVFSTALMD